MSYLFHDFILHLLRLGLIWFYKSIIFRRLPLLLFLLFFVKDFFKHVAQSKASLTFTFYMYLFSKWSWSLEKIFARLL